MIPPGGDWTVVRGKNGTWRVFYKGEQVNGCTGIEVKAEPGLAVLQLSFTAHEFTLRDADPTQD